MKFIHAADLHLRMSEAAQQLEALRAIIWLADQQEAEFILVAGDLFDSDHDADRLRTQVREVLGTWTHPVVLLAGNHDARSYGPTADYGENTLLAQGDLEVYDHLGVLPLVCLPYRSERGFADCRQDLAQLGGPMVVCCHGTLYLDQWLAWLREEKEDVGDYFPVYREDLKGLPIRYLAMGHFHSRFSHTDTPVTCCYPGSAYPVSTRELGHRSVALVQLDVEGPVKVTPIPLHGVPWYQEIALKSLPWREEEMLAQLEQSLEDLPTNARPAVSVRGYASDARGLRERLEKRLEELGGPKPRVELSDYSRLLENAFYRMFVEEIEKQSREADPEQRAISEKALEIVTHGFSRLQKRSR